MAEQANVLVDLAKKYVGERGVTASKVIGVIVAVGAAAEYGFRWATLLGDSLFRWWALLILIILCGLGYYVASHPPQRREDLPAWSKPEARKGTPRAAFAFVIAGFAFGAFLILDLGLEWTGFYVPLEYRISACGGGASEMAFKKVDGERLQKMPVNAADFIQFPDGLPPGDKLSPAIVGFERPPNFEATYRKRPWAKELVTRDITLTVSKFEEPPAPLLAGVTPSAATIIQENVVSFSLRRKSEPLPWAFKPTAMQHGEKEAYRKFKPISTTDNETNTLRIQVVGIDPGIYTVSSSIRLEYDFSK